MGNRGTYWGRIGDGLYCEIWGSGGWFLEEVCGVKCGMPGTGFSQIPAGEIYGKFSANFFEKFFYKSFLEIIFSVGKYSQGKILCVPAESFLLMVTGVMKIFSVKIF